MSETEGPVRKAFHEELEDIDGRVTRLFGMVIESLSAATETFLAGDRDTAKQVARRDELIDELEAGLSGAAERVLLVQAPVASEFHHLVSVLRIAPELERSGDLAEHIASRAARGLGTELPPTVRGIVEQLGQQVLEMWRTAADAFAEADVEAAARLDADDDVVDDLHQRLWDELTVANLPAPVTMEMALIARFYERLGDHATHICARLCRRR